MPTCPRCKRHYMRLTRRNLCKSCAIRDWELDPDTESKVNEVVQADEERRLEGKPEPVRVRRRWIPRTPGEMP